MKKCSTLLFALAAALAITPAALADTFTYSFISADGFTATGTLTGAAAGGGVFDITSGTILLTNLADAANPLNDTGTGTLTGGTGSVLTDKLMGGYTVQYDNEITPGSSPFVDGFGLAFLNGTDLVDIFSDVPFGGAGTSDYFLEESDGSFLDFGELTVTANVSATPEPSSFFLLGTGLLSLSGMLLLNARKSRNDASGLNQLA